MSSIDILNRTVNKSWRLWSEDQSDIAPIFEWIISSNGGTAIHDNVLLLGFKEEELEPTLVAKICRSQKYSWTLDSEYHRLVELLKCMGDEAIERLPKPIALENKENNHIFITNYLKGTNIKDLYNSNLNGNILKLKQFMVDAAKSLRFLNKMTATTINSGEWRGRRENEAGGGRKV